MIFYKSPREVNFNMRSKRNYEQICNIHTKSSLTFYTRGYFRTIKLSMKFNKLFFVSKNFLTSKKTINKYHFDHFSTRWSNFHLLNSIIRIARQKLAQLLVLLLKFQSAPFSVVDCAENLSKCDSKQKKMVKN